VGGVSKEPYALSVPADPAGLSTVRVFLRAVARSFDPSAERSDDLELIVSEVCASLVESGSRHLDIDVRSLGEEGLSVSVGADGVPSPAEDNSIRGDLLGTLAPDLTWGDHGARFTVSVASDDDAAQTR
jgi:anti-sigma regulatory factor (Ser/Thr protein kinase)